MIINLQDIIVAASSKTSLYLNLIDCCIFSKCYAESAQNLHKEDKTPNILNIDCRHYSQDDPVTKKIYELRPKLQHIIARRHDAN